MPYKYPDLKGSGRDLIIVNKSVVLSNVTGITNTQGQISSTSATPAVPLIYYNDPTGYFAPNWTTGVEAYMSFTFVLTVANTGSAHVFCSWGVPAAQLYQIYMNASEQVEIQTFNTTTAVYVSTITTAALGIGVNLIHVQFSTGTTRQVDVWANNVLMAATRSGPTGTPMAITGTERLCILTQANTAGGAADTSHPIAVAGFKRGQYTSAERNAQLVALNTA